MEDVANKIKQQIADNAILLYMKGTPQEPMCGFSARVVQVLMQCGVEFAYVNVLAEPDIRAMLPQVANWPTFPQLWVNGELVGGCDIVCDMHTQGQLAPLVKGAAS